MIDDFGTENDTETEPEEVVSDPGLDALRAAQAETEAKENLQEEAARFDVADFLENARLPRTAIRLYARPDLDVEMQLIRADMVEALQRGDALAGQRLARRLEETQRAYMAQAIDIEIEYRSKAWQAGKLTELKQLGLKTERDLTLGLIASQMVGANRFTPEELIEVSGVIGEQVNGLIDAWGALSGKVPGDLPHF